MEIIETKVNDLIVRPDGIIEIHPRDDWNKPDTVETAREAALLLQKIVSKGTYALMSFPPNLYIKKEVVKAYLEVEIGQVADAVVVKSFGQRILVKLAFQLTKNKVPSKVFATKEEAEIWLLEELEKIKNGQ